MERLSILARRLLITLSVLFCPLILQAQVAHSLVYSIPPPDGGVQTGGQLGTSVAVEGDYTVTGVPSDDTGGRDAGVVKVFHSVTGALLFTIPNPNPNGDRFGSPVAISGTRIVVGAYLASSGASTAGSAYVYDLTSATPTAPIVTLNNPTPAANDNFGYSVAISGTRVVVGADKDDTGATDAGSAYVYELTSATPTVPTATLNNPTPAERDNFGTSVAISGTRIVVGAFQDDTGATDAGSAYVYNLTSATPTVPITRLNKPNPAAIEYFGRAVAMSGTRIIVGANLYGTAGDLGSAYVFDLGSATPAVPIATLNNPTAVPFEMFGRSVAISGARVVVGANQQSSPSYAVGMAYVYDLSSVTPTVPIVALNNPTPASADIFGLSVAISGTRVVVGAYLDDTGATDAGSAYVYELTSVIPSIPIATLNNPGHAPSDNFGQSVAISGTRIVVGAYQDDTGATNAGRAYVFDLTSATPAVPVVTLNNPSPADGDNFGYSVAISDTRVVVGAYLDDTGASNSGCAYVYDLTSATPAVPIATLNNPSPASGDGFGNSVAISGTRIVVGARGDDTVARDAGSAYVYELTSATPTVPIATLNNPTPAANDNFGNSVAISGTRVAVGAYQDNTGATYTGSAYVYDLTSGTPTVPFVTLNNPSPGFNDNFGISVAISGTRVVVGAYLDYTGATQAGSAYVYDLTGGTPTVPSATLNNPAPANGDNFGISVAISGTRVVVGAYQDDTGATDTGSAYVYELANGTPTVPIATLNNPSPSVKDNFGLCVAISGTTITIGAPYEDRVMADKGYAYIYRPTFFPDIAVAQASPLTDGDSVSFGSINVGSSSPPLTFTISNPGTATLNDLALTGSTSEFTVSAPSGSSIPVGSGTVTFTVTFTPTGAAGLRTATLHLSSNVSGDENPFDIQLSGIANSPPTFSSCTLQATQGTPATLSRATLLARAADADGGTLSLSSVSAASTQGGSVFVGGEEINYSPPANFTGLDTFTVTIADGQGGSVEGNVMVVVTANGAPMGKLPMIMLQPSGKVAILFDGIPSQGYRIERSPDLLNWSPLQTTTAPTDGMLPYFDINPLPGQGFYRRIPQ